MVFTFYSCKTTEPSQQNNQENSGTNGDDQNVSGTEQTELVSKEVDGILFENIPANADVDKLKQELEEFFMTYEEIVLSKDYEKWLTVLSPKYYETFSDPDFYKEKGLFIYGINNIESYFYQVVYQSRIKLNNGQPLKIFKIVFNPKSIEKAKIFVRYEDKILTYYFIKIDQKWKISLKEEYEEGDDTQATDPTS